MMECNLEFWLSRVGEVILEPDKLFEANNVECDEVYLRLSIKSRSKLASLLKELSILGSKMTDHVSLKMTPGRKYIVAVDT